MKSKIMNLYKKDKNLALEVAKVLNYKIVATEGPVAKKITSDLKSIEKKLDKLGKILDDSGVSGRVNVDNYIKSIKQAISGFRVALLSEVHRTGK